MTDSALSLLGLALRGSNLTVGEEPVEESCKARRAKLVLIAADAADNSVRRAQRWAESGDIPWTRVLWDKETLGGALGRSTCAMAALTDRGLAAALAEKLAARDTELRPLTEQLAVEKASGEKNRPVKKKKSRAQKKPAVPET